MSTSGARGARCLRAAPLALCICAAIASLAPRAARAGDVLPVTSCADDGSPGTLRSVAANATPGAIIDLSALSCSTITLENGAIEPAAGVFTLHGPGMDRLTIDGNGRDRIIKGDSITIEGLTLTNGRVSGDSVDGGCVDARVDADLRASRVTACSAEGVHGASGGGVFGGYSVSVIDSIVSGNSATADSGGAYGGGIAAFYHGVYALRSTISDNTVAGLSSRGGGVYSVGGSLAFYSTVSGNTADDGGGWYGRNSWAEFVITWIAESTISGNTARRDGGGWLVYDMDLAVSSSTIAFNQAETGVVGGLFFKRAQDGLDGLGVNGSIIAQNAAGDPSLTADFDTDSANAPFATGNGNLFSEVGRLQPGHIIGDPMLAPLAPNGGPTQTHALLPGSPAIDGGNNIDGFETDQRGRARTSGDAPDMGAYELQVDAIFASGFD